MWTILLWSGLVVSVVLNVLWVSVIISLGKENQELRQGNRNTYAARWDDIWTRSRHWAFWDTIDAVETQYEKALDRDKSHQCIYRDEFERTRQKLEHMAKITAAKLE